MRKRLGVIRIFFWEDGTAEIRRQFRTVGDFEVLTKCHAYAIRKLVEDMRGRGKCPFNPRNKTDG